MSASRPTSDERRAFKQSIETLQRARHREFAEHFRNRRLVQAWVHIPNLFRA